MIEQSISVENWAENSSMPFPLALNTVCSRLRMRRSYAQKLLFRPFSLHFLATDLSTYGHTFLRRLSSDLKMRDNSFESRLLKIFDSNLSGHVITTEHHCV